MDSGKQPAKYAAPGRGDVFAKVEVEELEPTLWEVLLRFVGIDRPRHLIEIDYRYVIEVSPHTVLYRDTTGELKAAWLTEWGDWVIGAELLREGTEDPDPDWIEACTGEREIPFHLFYRSDYKPNKESDDAAD